MTAIEEAREQARAAAEIVEHRLADRWLAGSLVREADKDVPALRTSLHALRTLLDATEPPSEDVGPAASCHLCVGAGGYEDYGGEWAECSCQRTPEPLRDADGDMISSGAHRKISMSGDGFFVCDTCTNVLGLNVRWDHASKREDHQAAVEPLPIKPAEDEREALVERIAGTIAAPWLVSHGTTWGDLVQRSRDPYMRDAREVLRVVEVAGYSKGPRPITDEMVEAGAKVLNDAGWTYEGTDEPGCWCEDCQAVCMPPTRAILEAAEGARR